jgi:predicted nucleotidyltransferase component of viral defense system
VTKGTPKNIAASVRQRLQNLARQHKDDFQLVLSRYALERLLHRMSKSPYGDQFIVKGAVLFHLWTDQPYRPTRDIDLLAKGDHSVRHVETVFRNVCDQSVEDDGLVFASDSVAGEVIKPDQEYQGVRVQLQAKLERARIPVQIDIGFGDAITPGPQEIEYPSMLGYPTPTISIYPKETVIAEKLQAMVMLGMGNSRMKDFFDLWVLAQRFEFSGELVARAIKATFERRRTPIPQAIPLPLTAEFHNDVNKQKQWKAFVTKGKLAATTASMPDLVASLRQFLMPPLNRFDQTTPSDRIGFHPARGGP